MEVPLRSLHSNTPRAFVLTVAAITPHSPVRWSIRAQDTTVSFRLHFLQLQLSVHDDIRLSHLLYGTERAGAQDALRAPLEELRGR